MDPEIPDFESMSVDELRTWSPRRICESDPRVLRATGSKDAFTEVLFIRITWKPDAKRSPSRDPYLSLLERTLTRWGWPRWVVVVTDEPAEPPPRRRTATYLGRS